MITNYTAKTLGYSLVSSISEKLSDASDIEQENTLKHLG
jgi:hypothetical protein